MKANILHLYYDILNLYGEYGNVNIIKKHIEDQGIEVNVEKKTIGDEIDFSKYSFIYMGCGTENNLDYVLKDIKKYTNQINSVIKNGTVFLATGNSFEMFGRKIDSQCGLGIFDFETSRLEDRITSDIIYEKIIYTDENNNQQKNIDNFDMHNETTANLDCYEVVGFVNKMTEVYHNSAPLFTVKCGIGDNKQNDFEGIKYYNFYGTHVIGPILAKNYLLLRELVINICKNIDSSFIYKEVEYKYEKESYNMLLNLLKSC